MSDRSQPSCPLHSIGKRLNLLSRVVVKTARETAFVWIRSFNALPSTPAGAGRRRREDAWADADALSFQNSPPTRFRERAFVFDHLPTSANNDRIRSRFPQTM